MVLKIEIMVEPEALQKLKYMTSNDYRLPLMWKIIALHKRRVIARLNFGYGHITRARAFVDAQAPEKPRKGKLIPTGAYKLI